jgi:hypothetical protein
MSVNDDWDDWDAVIVMVACVKGPPHNTITHSTFFQNLLDHNTTLTHRRHVFTS